MAKKTATGSSGEERLYSVEWLASLEEIQARASGTNVDTVAEYAEAMKAGAKFPAVTVYEIIDEEGAEEHLLVGGIHRVAAAVSAGVEKILACVVKGTRTQATLAAVGENATHGRRRSRADVREAIRLALGKGGMWKASNREVAEACMTTHPTVAEVKKEMVEEAREAKRKEDEKKRKAKEAKKEAEADAPESEEAERKPEPEATEELEEPETDLPKEAHAEAADESAMTAADKKKRRKAIQAAKGAIGVLVRYFEDVGRLGEYKGVFAEINNELDADHRLIGE